MLNKIIFFLALFFYPSLLLAHRLPIDIQLGYEKNEAILTSNGVTKETRDFEFNNRPVIKIITPALLGCFSQTRSNGIYGDSCDGIGLRAAASQKRLRGSWFDSENTSISDTEFVYNSTQTAFEILGGRLNQVGIFAAIGLRVGLSNYDLTVLNDGEPLFFKQNQQTSFVNGILLFDLGYILTAPLGLGRDFWSNGFFGSQLFIMYSYESSLSHTVNAPNINKDESIDVDFQIRTQTVTLEFLF